MAPPKGHPAYNVNGEGGRPEDYTTEVIEKMADELIEWIDSDESHFWYKDFCLKKRINPKYMALWAKKNDRFRIALDHAKYMQESRIFKGSMTNNYNSSMSKLALTNWHEWKEKSEQTLLGDAQNPLSFAMQQVENSSQNFVDNDEAD